MHNSGVNTPDAALASQSYSRSALRHELSRRLLVDILRGELPPGTPLRVMKLAARFGTSSTPTREALLELETLGVVEFVHNRGARVGPFGSRELREVFDLRGILETEAARSACGQIETESLKRLQAVTEHLASDCAGPDRARRAMETDLELHDLIAARCGNLRLEKEIQRYRILVGTVYQVVGPEASLQREAMQEHLAILEALLANDPDESAARMSRHVARTARRTEAAMFGGKRAFPA